MLNYDQLKQFTVITLEKLSLIKYIYALVSTKMSDKQECYLQFVLANKFISFEWHLTYTAKK